MKQSHAIELFRRHPDNPILRSSHLPYQVNTVLNAGATQVGDDIELLMRVEDRRGISHFSVARSSDGISNWRIEERPSIMPDPDSYPEEIWGIEDPRITYLEEKSLWEGVLLQLLSDLGCFHFQYSDLFDTLHN